MTTSTRTPVVHVPRNAGRLAFHYMEMLAAMFVGMLVVGALRDLLGLTVEFGARPGTSFLLMATDMALGMSAWMRIRGHGAVVTLQMCAVMYLPAALIPLVWSGAMAAMTFMVVAHLVMMLAMLAVLARHQPRGETSPRR